MKILFIPFSVVGGLFAGFLGKKLFEQLWGVIDDEEAIRDLLQATPHEFGFEDITDLPWLEIDFPEDIRRAEHEILPRLLDELNQTLAA